MRRRYLPNQSWFFRHYEPCRTNAARSHTRNPSFERIEERTLLSGQNLITNGDFALAITGFTSGYTYSPGNILDPGTYDVVDNPAHSRPNDNESASYGDHTSGTGLMLAVNGTLDPT